MIAENTPDSVPASHAEVLAAVQSSGRHVESIVKKIVTSDVVGVYLQSVPPLPFYEIHKKKKVSSGASPAQSSQWIFYALPILAAAIVSGLFILRK